MQKSRKFHQSFALIMMSFFLLSCTCYGLNSAATFESNLWYISSGNWWSGRALDCSRFSFTRVEQSEDGRVLLLWSSDTEAVGIFFYHEDREIHQVSVENGVDYLNWQINWDSLEGADTVEIEGRNYGELGDVCVIRDSLSRPVTTVDVPNTGMLCADLRLTAPLGGMANAVETFYWDVLAGAESYRLNVYSNGVLLLGQDAAIGDTNLSIDVSSAAIGGETPLEVELIAFDAAGNSCSQRYTIAREAAPPQVISPTATPSCAEDPSAPYC